MDRCIAGPAALYDPHWSGGAARTAGARHGTSHEFAVGGHAFNQVPASSEPTIDRRLETRDVTRLRLPASQV